MKNGWRLSLVGLVILGLVISSPIQTASAAAIVYVKANATGANNGTSWANAYTSLATAMTNAVAGSELWIAAGIYKPTTTTNRGLSFNPTKDLTLYGGFAGTETSLSQRDYIANKTILSGDLGTPGVTTDNSSTVVLVNQSNLTIDGLTITGARNDGTHNGGLEQITGTVNVNHVTFLNNYAYFNGAGLGANQLSTTIIKNSYFLGNTSRLAGGGLYSTGRLTVVNTVFSGNAITDSSNGYGAALYLSPTGNITQTLVNITVANSNDLGRGTVYGYTSSTDTGQILIENSIFSGGAFISSFGDMGRGYVYNSYYPANSLYHFKDYGGNIAGSAPFFVNACGADAVCGTTDDNYALNSNSPAKDKGNNSYNTEPYDIAGNPRTYNGTMDMGAYEYTPSDSYTGSFDGNSGSVFASNCNANGWVRHDQNLADQLNVKVFSDGVAVASGVANNYRSDLPPYCTNGTCSFYFNLWGLVTHNASHTIKVQAQKTDTTWIDLGSPKTLTCQDSALGFSQSSYSVAEGGLATITVTLTPASLSAVTVNFSTSPGTALVGTHYSTASGSLTFTPGDTSKTFAVQTLDDLLHDSTHSLTVGLSNASGAGIGTSSATLNVTDNDPVLVLGFGAAAYTIAEGDQIDIPVSLSQASPLQVTVQYATSNGTAILNKNYYSASGTLVFSPGETTHTIHLTSINESNREGDVNFSVALSTPAPASNITLGTSSAIITETDDDPVLTIGYSSGSFEATESNSSTIITVSLNRPSDIVTTVGYYTAGDSAIAGTHYWDVAGTLYFAPGVTQKVFSVPLIDDSAIEGDSTVMLFLSNPNGETGVSLGNLPVTLTIHDNDSGTAFSASLKKAFPNLAYRLALGDFSISVSGQSTDAVLAVAQTAAPETIPTIPPNFKSASAYFEINLTDGSGHKVNFTNATICFPYKDSDWQNGGVLETSLKLLHYENSQWVDITKHIDPDQNQVCGVANSFSQFAVAGGSADSSTSMIVLRGGSLSVVSHIVDFGTVKLDGSEKQQAGVTDVWTAADPTGMGAGWRVSISADDFKSADGHTIPVNGLSVKVAAENITQISGNARPNSAATSYLPLSQTGQTVLSAPAATGMGVCTFQPEFLLLVPPGTYARSYSANISVVILSGP